MSEQVNTASSTTPRQKAPSPPSPCVGICAIDESHGFCSGCGRTPEDIAQWSTSTQEHKSTIWRALPARLARLGLHVFRLPATPAQITAFFELSLVSKAGTWEIGIADRPLRFDATSANYVTCDPSGVTAKNSNGDVIRLIEHERVRVFGLVDNNNLDRLSAVAIGLTRERAEMKKPDDPADAQALASSYPYARFSLCRPADGGADRLRAETMLAEVDVAACGPDIAALQSFHFDRTAPTPLGIPSVFAVAAVFRARDRDWLSGAMMP